MEIIELTKNNTNEVVSKAVDILKNGGIVIYPTETCYGIGVDATNAEAVKKILKYKTKRKGKPMSIAVTGIEMAKDYVFVNETAENIYENYLPGPITVVSQSKGLVSEGVESPHKTVGIRIPDNKIILEVVEKLGKPVTSTSANASYKKTPYKIEDILNNISEKQKQLIDLIIDAGELEHNPPSTVVDTTLNEFRILRQGKIKFKNKEKIISNSVQETEHIGENLMNKYKHYLGYKSIIFALQGELGAGKTHLAKGIGKALGVKENINSPTFIIESNYEIEKQTGSHLSTQNTELIHIDTWRLNRGEEILEMDFIEQVNSGNVFVIEWADKIESILESVKADAVLIWVKIQYGKNENERKFEISF